MISKNRQVFYKILQMDAGTESYLGFCKSNARSRLQNEYNGDERVGFRSSGNVGDVFYNVSVIGAQGGDVYVRIQLSVSASDSIFFGYGKNVEMRCKCRAVVIKKTAVVAPTYTSESSVIGVFGVTEHTTTLVVTTKDYMGTIQSVITGTQTYAADLSSGTYVNFFVDTSQVGAPLNVGARWRILNATYMGPVPDASGLSDVSPTYESLVAAIPAKAVERIGVFLTNGSELGAYVSAYETVLYQYIDKLYKITNDNNDSDFFPASWGEGSKIPYLTTIGSTDYTIAEVILSSPVSAKEKNVCYNKFDIYDSVLGPGINSDLGHWTEETRKIFVSMINTDQITAYVRENTRRLRCSNAQQLLLRNGFLPPEFEYFVRSFANTSTRVKAKLLMEVVSDTSPVIEAAADYALGGSYRRYRRKVVLKYQKTVEGVVQDVIGSFEGTYELRTIVYRNTDGVVADTLLVSNIYNSYPLLDSLRGVAEGGIAPLVTPSSGLTDGAIAHDFGGENIMFYEATGEYQQCFLWTEDDTYEAPTFSPDVAILKPLVGTYENYDPPVPQKTTSTISIKHPDFLLEYLKASPPIEFETDSLGVKTAVTPSTDWLSSRMNDGEEFKVVPLNFVQKGATFTPTAELYPDDTLDQLLDRCVFGKLGIFPYRIQTSVGVLEIASLLVYGYAVVKYNQKSNSLTVKKWVEFTSEGKMSISPDDTISLDDELNPTKITVNGKTHAMSPQNIVWDDEWEPTNCVCIGDKVPWTDIKTTAKTQKTEIKSETPTTSEMSLYKAVSNAIK